MDAKCFSMYEKVSHQQASMPGPTQLAHSTLDISVGKKVVYNYFIQEPKSDLQRSI